MVVFATLGLCHFRIGIHRLPWVYVNHSFNMGLDEFLGAVETRLHGAVKSAVFHRDAETGGAQKGVLLGMHADA